MDRVTRVDDLVKVRNVVVSVSDKTNLERFAPMLLEACPGMRFYATGGTHRFLTEVVGDRAPQKVVEITRYSTRPVTHSGLARTTDFKLYLGLLADPWNDVHVNDVSASGAVFFDMVVSNLTPFPDAEAAPAADVESTRLAIDIGGPGMVRAGCRNFVRVAVVADPADYDAVVGRIAELGGKTDLAMRLELARKALRLSTKNDERITDFFDSLTPERVRASYGSRAS